MPTRSQLSVCSTIVVCLCLGLAGHAQSQPAAPGASVRENVVTSLASGTFEVKLTPQAVEDGADAGLGRMTIDKQFHGDLEGTSKGWMISAMGTLKGRQGSFVLQHSGTMNRGTAKLSVTVVPDSGTGQLEGLAGTLTIKIDAGKHSYEFEYTLSETP
jgi:hypothetical protein